MKRRLSVLLVATLASALLPAARVAAHPSDLNTLTLDLILDRGGLVLIDAAANHATYEDAPSTEQREAIAGDVLDTLGVPRDTAEVDSSRSLLYHEVGFTVWLHTPFANTSVPGEVQLGSPRATGRRRESGRAAQARGVPRRIA